MGGSLVLDNGSVIGGDWDCYPKGLTAEACSALYLRDIKARTATDGAIVLLHHNYLIPGQYEYDLTREIIEGLPPNIRVISILNHPAFNQPAQTAASR